MKKHRFYYRRQDMQELCSYHILKKGRRVIVLDLMIYGEDVLPKNPALTVIKGDIRNQELMKSSIPGHDIVIHRLAFLTIQVLILILN